VSDCAVTRVSNFKNSLTLEIKDVVSTHGLNVRIDNPFILFSLETKLCLRK